MGVCYRFCCRFAPLSARETLRFGPYELVARPGVALRRRDRRVPEKLLPSSEQSTASEACGFRGAL